MLHRQQHAWIAFTLRKGDPYFLTLDPAGLLIEAADDMRARKNAPLIDEDPGCRQIAVSYVIRRVDCGSPRICPTMFPIIHGC